MQPLFWLYRGAMSVPLFFYRHGLRQSTKFPVPVIVVGNITVGGTGKTPLVIWLANWLKSQGFKPGIVSRGYGGRAKSWPQQVNAQSDPQTVGDEPVLIARKTDCPMFVGPKRVEAVKQLLAAHDCNVIVSDDGLQHYALARDVEIAVMDSERQLGNGLCLPVGPLREPAARLNSVDFIITNGVRSFEDDVKFNSKFENKFVMCLKPGEIYNLFDDTIKFDLNAMKNKKIHAVSGIGNPQRFFSALEKIGLNIIPHAFPDHYFFKTEDINFENNSDVIMTEKDAVKCRQFVNEKHWCLPVAAELDARFADVFKSHFRRLMS